MQHISAMFMLLLSSIMLRYMVDGGMLQLRSERQIPDNHRPRPVAEPKSLTLNDGETGSFICNPNTDASATVTWSYQVPGGALPNEVYSKDYELIISSAKQSNAGTYICTTMDRDESLDSQPVYLHVTARSKTGNPDILITVSPHQDTTVKEGTNVAFDCLAQTADNRVFPTVRWTKTGNVQLTPYTTVSGGRLSISSVVLSDSGQYVCSASHNGREAEIHVQLIVQSNIALPSPLSIRPCTTDETQCQNDECIKTEQWCDGKVDCSDRSDEANCYIVSPPSCEPNQFRCPNNACVQHRRQCNVSNDCDKTSCGRVDDSPAPCSRVCDRTDNCRCRDDRRRCSMQRSYHCDGHRERCECVIHKRCQQFCQQKQCQCIVPKPCQQCCQQTRCETLQPQRTLPPPQQPQPTLSPTQSTCSVGAIDFGSLNIDRCHCKSHATGLLCDKCISNSYHLSARNPNGCIACYCSGVTTQCSSSRLYRISQLLDYRRGEISNALSVVTSDPTQPISPRSPARIGLQNELIFSSFNEVRNYQTLYWRLPSPFGGNKITAYGGYLKYTFSFSGIGAANTDADIILRGNNIDLHYTHRDALPADRVNTITVDMFEDRWLRHDGLLTTREHLMMALANLDTILIKVSYLIQTEISSLFSVEMQYATERYVSGGALAHEVETCSCPRGYTGTSCEDCANGFARTSGGLYLGTCERCECHGHALECDAAGSCIDCEHNTEGDHCERCKLGYTGNARNGTCHLSLDSSLRPVVEPKYINVTEGESARFLCKPNAGTSAAISWSFKVPNGTLPDNVKPEKDQLVINMAELSNSGAYFCTATYPHDRTINSLSVHLHVNERSEELLRPIVEPNTLNVTEGENARFSCKPESDSATIDWSFRLPNGPLPDNVKAEKYELVINSAELSNSGAYFCTASDQDESVASQPVQLYVNEKTDTMSRPVVEPKLLTVTEGENASLQCKPDGDDVAAITWSYQVPGSTLPGGALPDNVKSENDQLVINLAKPSNAGAYFCTATYPNDLTVESDPVYVYVNELDSDRADIPLRDQPVQDKTLDDDSSKTDKRPKPIAEPTSQTVIVGETASFICNPNSESTALVAWSYQSAGNLLNNENVYQDGHRLVIDSARFSDAGAYICTVTNQHGSVDSQPVHLHITGKTGTAQLAALQYAYKSSVAKPSLSVIIGVSIVCIFTLLSSISL